MVFYLALVLPRSLFTRWQTRVSASSPVSLAAAQEIDVLRGITMPSKSEVADYVAFHVGSRHCCQRCDDDTTIVESMDATADIFVCVDEAENDEPQKQARK